MKKLLTVICLIVCIVSAASAQKMLTLEEAIATALQYNYDIRVAKNDSLLYDLNQSYAYAAFLPRLNATSAIVFNNNDLKQQLADGSIRQQKGIRSDNTQASLNLNWTLFDGLKMFATRDKINEFVTLGKLTIRNQLVNTIANVINTYYDIVRQKQQLKAIEEQMGINEELVLQAEKKLSVGLAAKPELLQAKIDLNAQKAAKLTQLTLIEQLKEQLNEWMAVAPGSSYDVADSIPINMNLNAGEILAASAVSNPAFEVAQQQIKIASLTLKERKADRFPVIQFNSAYNFSRTNNQTVLNNFTPLFNRNRGFNYGFSATIPLFNGFNVRRLIREAAIDVEYRTLLKDYEVARVQIAATRAYKEYDLQKKTLALEEENILMAKENVTIAMERYRLGLSTVLELRESQRSLEVAYSRLINARYNTKVAETELMRLRGDLVQ